MLTPREKSPLPENVPRGGLNLRRCGQRAQALPTELFRPLGSCLRLYPDSVYPELAWRHTIWKWPSVAPICVFRGGLQARIWQAKIGLRSFMNAILTCRAEGYTRKLLCFVRSSPHGSRSASRYKTSLTEVTMLKRLCLA